MGHQIRHRVLFPIWVRFIEPTQTRRKRREVGEGALEDPKQRRGRNGLFEVYPLVPFGEEGHVLEKVCRGGQFLEQRGLPHQKVLRRNIPMN